MKYNSALRILPLNGVANARDLGGLPLPGGREIRKGCLIRTGRLSDMTEQDFHILEEKYKVTEIIDLRNEQEIKEHPDPRLSHAVFHHLPLLPCETDGISREDCGENLENHALRLANRYRGGAAERLLRRMYPDMIQNTFCIKQLHNFFQLLLTHETGALLFHCTSGKDRTGLCSALILRILGASWETVLSDYLFTNYQVQTYRDELCGRLRLLGAEEEAVRQIYILESVRAEYLESCMAAIEKLYGSFELFVSGPLGIDREARRKLEEKYTCQAMN